MTQTVAVMMNVALLMTITMTITMMIKMTMSMTHDDVDDNDDDNEDDDEAGSGNGVGSEGDANAGDDYDVDEVTPQELLCHRLHLLAAHRGRPAGGRPGHTHLSSYSLFQSIV